MSIAHQTLSLVRAHPPIHSASILRIQISQLLSLNYRRVMNSRPCYYCRNITVNKLWALCTELFLTCTSAPTNIQLYLSENLHFTRFLKGVLISEIIFYLVPSFKKMCEITVPQLLTLGWTVDELWFSRLFLTLKIYSGFIWEYTLGHNHCKI